MRNSLVLGRLHLKHKMFQTRLCKYNLFKNSKCSLQFNFYS